MLNLAELNVIASERIYLPLGLKDNLVIFIKLYMSF